jgi:hypothetical protein
MHEQQLAQDMRARAARLKSFDRRVYDRAERARVRRASSISIDLGLFSGVDSAGGAQPISDFAALFPGAYFVVQGNKGLSYGAQLRADAGNTSTATMACSGALPALALAPPIWLRGLGSGTCDIYYDGIGVAPAMAGAPWANGVPINLTGAASGIVITPSAAGTMVGGETWKATCRLLQDQSGNARHFVQNDARYQPIVTVGLSGISGLHWSTVNTWLSNGYNPFQPSVVPYSWFMLMRQLAWSYGRLIFHAGGFIPQMQQRGISPQVSYFNYGAFSAGLGASLGTWAIVEIDAQGTTADRFKIGVDDSTGNMFGDFSGAGPVSIGGSTDGSGNTALFEVLAFAHAPKLADWAPIRAACVGLGALA